MLGPSQAQLVDEAVKVLRSFRMKALKAGSASVPLVENVGAAVCAGDMPDPFVQPPEVIQ